MMKRSHRPFINWGLIPGLLFGLSVSPLFQGSGLAAWQPRKPVEFIIMAGKGGGADRMSRLMQSIIEKHKFSAKPFVPKNKPGGSGAEALVYLKQHKGDNHVIMVTLNSFYTTPLRQPKLGVDIATFTPIGRMAEDTFLLWVHKDSGIKNVD
ncbi:MAG: Bug family tripartite tricarboxylate transporter substrate binding protein, partial [Candidatus Binatia bacterium]